jgi:hypothetical protein
MPSPAANWLPPCNAAAAPAGPRFWGYEPVRPWEATRPDRDQYRLGNSLAGEIHERDVRKSGELIFDLRVVTDDDDHRIGGPEQHLGAGFDGLGRGLRDLALERFRVVSRQLERVHRVDGAGEAGLGRVL